MKKISDITEEICARWVAFVGTFCGVCCPTNMTEKTFRLRPRYICDIEIHAANMYSISIEIVLCIHYTAIQQCKYAS